MDRKAHKEPGGGKGKPKQHKECEGDRPDLVFWVLGIAGNGMHRGAGERGV